MSTARIFINMSLGVYYKKILYPFNTVNAFLIPFLKPSTVGGCLSQSDASTETHVAAYRDIELVQTCARVSLQIFGEFSHQKYTQENPLVLELA